jgi:uncharacterized membrane protein YeaQ/YmgE (transglycosylase-associated protein family)
MTPQAIETREEHEEGRLSTSDLAATLGASTPKAKAAPETNLPLFAQNDTQDFRSRWEKIQIGFMDEPRNAVEQADELVASAIKRLAEVFATEREGILLDILLGVVGALVGGWLFHLFGAAGVNGLNLYSLFVAVIGSVVFLVTDHAIRRV